ncbi:fumarylacetoacetate hydrolase family protein [Ornithinibacillus contaminans]|uniref:fumarylacetoacetate hydrolase family protein n=1 Tax=Ornithinibacillus contaminans TaxID=694055 RepID=UPI00064E1157|nr:fumarylacetoacetate hydrolase family protein [Ornithinibacillus contaminans]
MKLVSYRLKNKDVPLRVGIMEEERIVDVQEVFQRFLISHGERQEKDIDQSVPSDPNRFFKRGYPVFERVKEAYNYYKEKRLDGNFLSRNDVYLSTPISEPSKIICVGKNYAEHAAEMKSDVPDFPVLFAKFSNALIGPEDVIQKSPATAKLDYEVELTIVIGKKATKVKREDALNYIAGYTIGNDISARDLQKRTQQWLQGKTLDNSTPIGPWVVTADEVGNPSGLVIKSYVNGELRQSSNTEKLIFDVPFLMEFISDLITLNPGDIIMTGTPDGVAFGMDEPKFLQAGDVVALEIEKIGQMENRVGE